MPFTKAKACLLFRIHWLCNSTSHFVIICYLGTDNNHQIVMTSDHCLLAFVKLVVALPVTNLSLFIIITNPLLNVISLQSICKHR